MEGDKEKEREHTHGIKKLNAEIFPFYLFIFLQCETVILHIFLRLLTSNTFNKH